MDPCKIPLGDKVYAYVDRSDLFEVQKHSWCLLKTRSGNYAKTGIKGKTVLLHQFIMGGLGVDHVDGDGLNCTRSNMRSASRSQNNANRRPRDGKKIKCVTFDTIRQKWRAYIRVDGERIHLGYFSSEQDAAQAYNTKAIEVFGEFARLNNLEGSDGG